MINRHDGIDRSLARVRYSGSCRRVSPTSSEYPTVPQRKPNSRLIWLDVFPINRCILLFGGEFLGRCLKQLCVNVDRSPSVLLMSRAFQDMMGASRLVRRVTLACILLLSSATFTSATTGKCGHTVPSACRICISNLELGYVFLRLCAALQGIFVHTFQTRGFVLRASCVHDSKLDSDEVKHAPSKANKFAASSCRKNSLLQSETHSNTPGNQVAHITLAHPL